MWNWKAPTSHQSSKGPASARRGRTTNVERATTLRASRRSLVESPTVMHCGRATASALRSAICRAGPLTAPSWSFLSVDPTHPHPVFEAHAVAPRSLPNITCVCVHLTYNHQVARPYHARRVRMALTLTTRSIHHARLHLRARLTHPCTPRTQAPRTTCLRCAVPLQTTQLMKGITTARRPFGRQRRICRRSLCRDSSVQSSLLSPM